MHTENLRKYALFSIEISKFVLVWTQLYTILISRILQIKKIPNIRYNQISVFEDKRFLGSILLGFQKTSTQRKYNT